jgi:hypothetical protein
VAEFKKKPKAGLKYKVTSVYKKPLEVAELQDRDPLDRFKRELSKRLKSELQQEAFSSEAKRALGKAIRIETKPHSLQVVARHPAWRPLVEGQKKEQMTWLVKSKAPIPIITEKGELIFRSATPRSMKNGSWVHPGREPSHFVDRAKKQARKYVKDKMAKELAKVIARGIGNR